MPTHCRRKKNSRPTGVLATLLKASAINTTTTHERMIANERLTRSRRLNDKTYSSSEKAVMAIPAVSKLLSVRSALTIRSDIHIDIAELQLPGFTKENTNILIGIIQIVITAKLKPQPGGELDRREILRLHFQHQVTAAPGWAPFDRSPDQPCANSFASQRSVHYQIGNPGGVWGSTKRQAGISDRLAVKHCDQDSRSLRPFDFQGLRGAWVFHTHRAW